jgi:hypothetical protein
VVKGNYRLTVDYNIFFLEQKVENDSLMMLSMGLLFSQTRFHLVKRRLRKISAKVERTSHTSRVREDTKEMKREEE